MALYLYSPAEIEIVILKKYSQIGPIESKKQHKSRQNYYLMSQLGRGCGNGDTGV